MQSCKNRLSPSHFPVVLLQWTAFDGEKLVDKLKSEGINAAVIGRVTDSGRYVTFNGIRKELVPQEKDEIYRVDL